MAQITDYASLQANVADWLLRSDLTAQIPTFIQMAEARMNRDTRLRSLQSQDYDTLTTVAATAAVALPAGFNNVITLELQGNPTTELEYVTPAQFLKLRRAWVSATLQPTSYTIVAGELRLVPTPDAAYDIDMLFDLKIPSLSDSATSNWFLLENPDVYLYAVLCESAPFLDQDERIATWNGAYNERAEAFHVNAEARKYNGSPLKMRARTIGGTTRG